MEQSTIWSAGWREQVWSQLAQQWDVVIVGGGITGAGILRETAALGLRVLLVEQRDFAWGTSSRSSKMVHGGLRYLKKAQFGLTHASVNERQQLLDEAPGLVEPLGFLLASYRGDRPGRLVYHAGLALYDLLAQQWDHHYWPASEFQMRAPHIRAQGLHGGFQYGDAQTDDARLVLRLLREAVAGGGTALNYARVEGLVRDATGEVVGVRLRDCESGSLAEVRSRVVVNATGAWADQLRNQVGEDSRLRPLRGSHLVFPANRLPVPQAVSFQHPVDKRPVFVLPWEGVTLLGTTDEDHQASLDAEPRITPDEVAYLMAAVTAHFPTLNLTLDDVQATFSGVRPVIGCGHVAAPSEESRDHVVWQEKGLLTVTGGKLTTFRLIANDALQVIYKTLKAEGIVLPQSSIDGPIFNLAAGQERPLAGLDSALCRRLCGRYGAEAQALVAAAAPGELQPIPGTPLLWAELRWAARAEGVVHLDDLLLRRVRLGLLLPEGGRDLLPRIRTICQPELGWDNERWAAETDAYLALWQQAYGLPAAGEIPDWNVLLAAASHAKDGRRAAVLVRRKTWAKATAATLLSAVSLLMIRFLLRWKREQDGALSVDSVQ